MKNKFHFRWTRWLQPLAGLLLYFLWHFLVHHMNIFKAYTASIPLYIAIFVALFAWTLVRKNLTSLYAFVAATLIPLVGDGFRTGDYKEATLFFLFAAVFCGWGIFKLGLKPAKLKIKTNPRPLTRREILARVGLLLLLLFFGARQGDMIVSKLYFVPWPIYPDYVYPEGVQKVFFKSQDGTLLNGWYFHGKSPWASKRPVLLYVHGNAGNMAAQKFQFDYLMDWGYDVFTFDYRGFGLSEGQPTREGLWKDTQAAFQEMTFLQPGRKYAVVGFSMGSPYALELVAHEPRISAATFLTCFSSFRDIGIYTLQNWGIPSWAAPTLGRVLVADGMDAKDAERVDPLPPALFVQGTSDGNIPFAMTEKVAADYAGPHEFLPMPGYPHGDYFKGPLGEKFHQALNQVLSEKEGN